MLTPTYRAIIMTNVKILGITPKINGSPSSGTTPPTKVTPNALTEQATFS